MDRVQRIKFQSQIQESQKGGRSRNEGTRQLQKQNKPLIIEKKSAVWVKNEELSWSAPHMAVSFLHSKSQDQETRKNLDFNTHQQKHLQGNFLSKARLHIITGKVMFLQTPFLI